MWLCRFALRMKCRVNTTEIRCGFHLGMPLCFRHTLKLSGPPASIEKAKQAVEEVDKTLRAAGFQSSADDEDSPDCAACFCPIDRGDLYRLETCAHPFCNGCIVRQVCRPTRSAV